MDLHILLISRFLLAVAGRFNFGAMIARLLVTSAATLRDFSGLTESSVQLLLLLFPSPHCFLSSPLFLN